MPLLEEVVALTAAPGPALRLLMDAAPVLSALVLQVLVMPAEELPVQ